MAKMTMSSEDYLEAIYVLGVSGSEVKSTDVAAALCVSRPAVNKAMGELTERNFISKEAYGKITLTDAGKAEAERIYKRHNLLHDFLMMIGVSESTAALDCCKIEHFVSEETVKKLAEFMDKTKNG
jgi:Mn-dependent DtxR family transcriptional regulator